MEEFEDDFSLEKSALEGSGCLTTSVKLSLVEGVLRIAQAIEEESGIDSFGEVVALEVGSCVPGQAGEAKCNACGGEVLVQLKDGACGAVVDVSDGFSVDDEPAYWRRRGADEQQDLVGEAAHVCIKESSTETIEH